MSILVVLWSFHVEELGCLFIRLYVSITNMYSSFTKSTIKNQNTQLTEKSVGITIRMFPDYPTEKSQYPINKKISGYYPIHQNVLSGALNLYKCKPPSEDVQGKRTLTPSTSSDDVQKTRTLIPKRKKKKKRPLIPYTFLRNYAHLKFFL